MLMYFEDEIFNNFHNTALFLKQKFRFYIFHCSIRLSTVTCAPPSYTVLQLRVDLYLQIFRSLAASFLADSVADPSVRFDEDPSAGSDCNIEGFAIA